MKPGQNLEKLINSVKNLLGAYVLVILLIDGIITALMYKSLLRNDLLPYFVGGGALLIVFLLIAITILYIKYPSIFDPKQEVPKIETLSDQILTIDTRKEIYITAKKMIERANQIYDTTWGRIPNDKTIHEEKARKEYIDSFDSAIKAGKKYRHLFSSTTTLLEEYSSLKKNTQTDQIINPCCWRVWKLIFQYTILL